MFGIRGNLCGGRGRESSLIGEGEQWRNEAFSDDIEEEFSLGFNAVPEVRAWRESVGPSQERLLQSNRGGRGDV